MASPGWDDVFGERPDDEDLVGQYCQSRRHETLAPADHWFANKQTGEWEPICDECYEAEREAAER